VGADCSFEIVIESAYMTLVSDRIRGLTISFFPLVQVKKGTKREKSDKSKKLGVDWQKAGSGTC